MADFIWTGATNSDITNVLNWKTSNNSVATRLPGTFTETTDDIWFDGTHALVTTLEGSLTNRIRNAYFVQANVTGLTVGSMTLSGVSTAYDFQCDITCTQFVPGYDGAGTPDTATDGFTANKLVQASYSTITADTMYLKSGTYNGTLVATSALYIGNGAADTCIPTGATIEGRAASGAVTIATLRDLSCTNLTHSGAGTTILKQEPNKTLTVVKLITSSGVGRFYWQEDGESIITTVQYTQTAGDFTKLSFAGNVDANLTFNGTKMLLSGGTMGCSQFAVIGTTQMEVLANSWQLNVSHQANSQAANENQSSYAAYFGANTVLKSLVNIQPEFVSAGATNKWTNIFAKSAGGDFAGFSPVVTLGHLYINNITTLALIGRLQLGVETQDWNGLLTVECRTSTGTGAVFRGSYKSGTSATGVHIRYAGLGLNAGSTSSMTSTLKDATFTWNATDTTHSFSSGSGNYLFGDLRFEQEAETTITSNHDFTVVGDLKFLGGTIITNEQFRADNDGSLTVECTSIMSLSPTIIVGDGTNATTATYKWNPDTVLPSLSVAASSIVKPGLAETGSLNLTGSGTFDWNGGLTGNHLWHITAESATPWSINTVLNEHFVSGKTTTWRFRPTSNTGYSIALPTSIDGDVELGVGTDVALIANGAPIYTMSANTNVNGSLTLDWSESTQSASTYNAKLQGAYTLTCVGQNAGDALTIGALGQATCFGLKSLDSDFANTGTVAVTTITIANPIATSVNSASHTCALGTGEIATTLSFDGYNQTKTTTVTGTPTIVNFTLDNMSLILEETTTVSNITVTGAAIITPNSHKFVMKASGTINDSSTLTTSVAGLTFAGCNSLGTIECTGGTTAIAGSVICDSITINGGNLSQASGTAKKLWIRGGTSPTAIANHLPGYNGSASFKRVALNVYSGTFTFPAPYQSTSYNASDTLVIGNGDATEVHVYGTGNAVIGASPNETDLDLLTTIKWNTSRGINFAPDSNYSGTFSIYRSKIDGTVAMTAPLITATTTGTSQRTIKIHGNHLESTKAMGIARCTATDYLKFQITNNRYAAENGVGVLFFGGMVVPSGSLLKDNHINVLGTGGTICSLTNGYSESTYFEDNVILSKTMTSGTAVLLGNSSTILNKNTISVPSAVTPIDVNAAYVTSKRNNRLVGWSFDTTNENFGYRVRNESESSLISQWTNQITNNNMVISGDLPGAFEQLLVYEEGKWMTTGAANPVQSVVSSNVMYRYARDAQKVMESSEIIVDESTLTTSWTEYASGTAIALQLGSFNGTAWSYASITSGTAVTTAAGVMKVKLKMTMQTGSGFANLTVKDANGVHRFADSQAAALETQSAALQETGPFNTRVGIGGKAQSSSVDSHLSIQYNNPQTQTVKLIIDRARIDETPRFWNIVVGGQDENDRYEAEFYNNPSGTDIIRIIKYVSGTPTTLATDNVAINTTGSDVVMSLAFTPGGTPSLLLNVDGQTVNSADTTFTTGFYGYAAESNSNDSTIKRIEVYDGSATHHFLNDTELIFMPGSSWTFKSTTTHATMENVNVNSNQTTVFPNLLINSMTVVQTNVTFFAWSAVDPITSFVILKGADINVTGNIVLSGTGKLWLIGCTVSGTNGFRWKFDTDSVTYTDSPPLRIQGCMLPGILTTIAPVNATAFTVDDSTKNTSLIRMQSDKNIRVTRNSVDGLEFERMVFQGFESRLATLTCVAVQDATIAGKIEEVWFANTLVELQTPYCYIWKGKITQYNSRYLNPALTTLQFVFEVEEWRDD